MIPTPFTRSLHPGMGVAVAERTILRKLPEGKYETWGDVAERVAEGNALLCHGLRTVKGHDYTAEKEVLERHIRKATLLMSGRHLQHGDASQPERNLEIYSNCATSPCSFLLFMLLLNGSGVGRCYDDDMMLVNWNYAPNIRVVLSTSHADFDWSQDESLRDAKHKYAGDNVVWHEVADTREGWAKAIEIWETMTYQKVFQDHTLVLDFSLVRPKGSPILGMQGRPSSGPKPLMNALMKCATIKGSGMAPWRQAMYVDHYLAECVLVGGARRAARMATKYWKDKDALGFVQVKRPIEYAGMSMAEVLALRAEMSAKGQGAAFSFLWSSNNSVAVDAEFWSDVSTARKAIAKGTKVPAATRKAWALVNAIAEAAYGDGTGEPGLINVDKLIQNDEGWEGLEAGDYVKSAKYECEDDTKLLLSRLAKSARAKPFRMITNPCGEITINLLGGYCLIADSVPYHADTLDEAEDAFRVATRALIRANTMNSLYHKETARTNRIGVGITGIHEFAWKFFRVGFRDLVKPDFIGFDLLKLLNGLCGRRMIEKAQESDDAGIRSAAFWLTLSRFSRAVQDESDIYAKAIGANRCHTVTTIKPAGTTSKLFSLTEGWHLPAMAQYMRWVQFRSDSPAIAEHRANGYPTQELKSYSGTTIVGFPTRPAIGELGMGDELVTANEATPEDQYQWLKLGERFWIKGVTDDNRPLHKDGNDRGGQISYTLKYDPAVVSYENFLDMLIEHQSQVRCCSVLPLTDTSAYEYLPEEPLTKVQYEKAMREVQGLGESEDIGLEHVDCAGGACPVDFRADKP